MAGTAYRIARHDPSIGSALFDVGWFGFTGENPVTAGAQVLLDGVVVGASETGPFFGDGEIFSQNVSEPVDETLGWRARAFTAIDGIKVSSMAGYKSYASVAAAQTPTSSAITATTATVACDYTPNVVESTCSAQLQFKKTTDVSWLNAGSPQGTGGSVQVNVSRGITGLDPSTQYQVRLVITRTTVNDTTLTSAVHSFTTLAGEPDVTTQAATNVNSGMSGVPDDGEATLNGLVDRNDKTDTEWRFAVGASSGVYTAFSPWVATTVEPESVQAITDALTESATYFFRLEVRWNSGTQTKNGSELSFTVPLDPGVQAAEEDQVDRVEFDRKYGQAAVVPLAVRAPASSSSDRLLTTASPFAAGDVIISKDGGAFAPTTNLPVQVTASEPGRTLTLTAAEMQCLEAHILIRDQDGPAFRDLEMLVRTEMQLGSMDIDATANTNKSAMKLQGQGTGHGLEAIGGASGQGISGVLSGNTLTSGTAQAHGVPAEIKLATGANANDDYYNNTIVYLTGGTGAGQARAIVDYTGSTRVAVVDSSWVINPDSDSTYIVTHGPRTWQMYRGELTAMIADNADFGAKLQLICQRFSFKITQTATVQTLFKADSATTLATRSVSDAAGTQTIGKLS